MAGKKKSKKPAANPARGFATVSLPSKSKSASLIDTDVSTPNKAEPSAFQDLSTNISGTNGTEAQHKEVAIHDMSGEELERHLEEGELRDIVEQHAVKIKNDASRQVLRLQNERRQLRQQAERASLAGLDEELIDRILDDNLSVPRERVLHTKPKTLIRPDAEDLVLRLWALREILLQLEMPYLNDALSHVADVLSRQGFETNDDLPGLYEVFLWYASHVPESELPNYETGKLPSPHAVDVEEYFSDEQLSGKFNPAWTDATLSV